MRNTPLCLLGGLTFALMVYADSAPSCTGQYAASQGNCAQFEFNTNPVNPCINPTNGTTFYDISSLPSGTIDAQTEKMAMLITNVFENGDKVIGYGYCQAIGDNRGITSGYIGFTTGTNDAYHLIQNYTAQNANNSLVVYLPALASISALSFCDNGRNSTTALSGYCKAWQTEACSTASTFRNTQIAIGTDMYLIPSTRFAAMVGVQSNLGKAIFYDTIIQHGWQYVEPKINIWRIITLTGPMQANETEDAYLTRFLTTRRELQCCYPDNVWPPSADRTSDLMSLVSDWANNKDLANPVTLTNFGITVNGSEDTSLDTDNCKTSQTKSAGSKCKFPSKKNVVIAATVALTFSYVLMF